jgi:uncharacterized protein (DUF1919 family)
MRPFLQIQFIIGDLGYTFNNDIGNLIIYIVKILKNMRFFVNQDYRDSNAMGYATSNFIGHLHWQVRVNFTFYHVLFRSEIKRFLKYSMVYFVIIT